MVPLLSVSLLLGACSSTTDDLSPDTGVRTVENPDAALELADAGIDGPHPVRQFG